MSGFQFDHGEFEHMIRGVVDGAIKDRTRAAQRVIDRFAVQHHGQPVESIKSALRRVLEREGLKVPTARLNEMAQAISEGDRVKFQYKAA